MSMVESVLSTAIGFGVALLTQILVFPLFGFNPSLTVNLLITCIFTVVSIARQFCVRRLFEALHIRRPLSPFMQAVVAERYRQIEQEGWSVDHDNDHRPGELALAGAAYAISANAMANAITSGMPPACWPWSLDWWKPAGFRRDLVKAGALVLAEGERHDRLRKRKPVSEVPFS
jgi:hypothetical protein